MTRMGMGQDLGNKFTILDLVKIRKNIKKHQAESWLGVLKNHLSIECGGILMKTEKC